MVGLLAQKSSSTGLCSTISGTRSSFMIARLSCRNWCRGNFPRKSPTGSCPWTAPTMTRNTMWRLWLGSRPMGKGLQGPRRAPSRRRPMKRCSSLRRRKILISPSILKGAGAGPPQWHFLPIGNLGQPPWIEKFTGGTDVSKKYRGSWL